MSKFKVTNNAERVLPIPGSADLKLDPGETISIKGSSFSLSLAKLNKLFTVTEFKAVQPPDMTVESHEPIVVLTKQKRGRRKTKPTQTSKISGKVNNDG